MLQMNVTPEGLQNGSLGCGLALPLAREGRFDTIEPGMAFPARALQQLRDGQARLLSVAAVKITRDS